ncbi:MAG: phage holin family protein [Bacteroidota bacterium]
MMEKQTPADFSALWNDIREYFRIRLELLKLSAMEKGSKLAADLITNTIVLVFLLMAFLALAVTLAFFLSGLLNSYTKGFGCATLFFTLLACLMLWKKAAIEKIIAGIAIRRYFEKHCESLVENEITVPKTKTTAADITH